MKNYKQILKQYYKKYLNREPDNEGFAHYLSLLKSGKLNEEELKNEFINSAEYKVHQLIRDQLDYYPQLTGTYSYYEAKVNHLFSQYENESKISIENNGKVYFVNSSHFKLFWILLKVGLWEPNNFDIFDAFLDSNHSCIDLGAWIGSTVLYECQKAKHCYAVEPDPEAFKILKSNIDCNPNLISRISLSNNCVMNSSGVAYLTPFQEDWSGSHGTINEGLGQSRTRTIEKKSSESLKVNSITFQQLILENSINDCNFIKIDIEGAEFLVLPEMLEFIKKEKPTIYLSTHPTFMNNPKQSMEKIYNIIRIYDNIYDDRLRRVDHEHVLSSHMINTNSQLIISEKKLVDK